MRPSKKCIDLIKKYEGVRLSSYLCPASKWTIGYGNTKWPDGSAVKEGQKCTMQQAEDMLTNEVNFIAARLPNLKINQNQLDAVCSFIYNLGMGNFINSTLFKYIRKNPNDERIRGEFMKWTKAKVKGELKVLRGLVKRRQEEADLYNE